MISRAAIYLAELLKAQGIRRPAIYGGWKMAVQGGSAHPYRSSGVHRPQFDCHDVDDDNRFRLAHLACVILCSEGRSQ